MSNAQELENELASDEGAQNPNPAEPCVKSQDPDSSAPSSEDSAIEIAKLKETLARSQADYKNLVARTERERIEMGDYVTEKFVTKLLPSVDNLERLLSGTPENERGTPLYQGVQSTFSGIMRIFESLSVLPFESAGKPLDPDFHEAVAQVPGTEGIVISELEKGYKLRKKVIRHAKVTVGKGSD